ncbi:MAG: phosphate signaling complex protein PhoU [Rhodanobacteraceae bacterium]|nr:MAG: phosphate signaling complex protein PhoU [Rhodanobacteraceae bacterium]
MDIQNHHIVKSYDAELQRLMSEIADMGDVALTQVEHSLLALEGRDATLARQVIDGDDAIDTREREVSHEVLRLLALRQPSARDLREVMAALRIASDIERIADHAVGVARLSLAMPAGEGGFPENLHALGLLTCDIVHEVLRAWRATDAALAHAVWQRDDDLDRTHAVLFHDLLARMRQTPDDAAWCTHLMFVAKNLERIGDHATNIAENVWFVVEGESGLS